MRKIFIFVLFYSALFGEERVVLISGASSGIGLATAKISAQNGWKVWAGYRTNLPKTEEPIRFCMLDVTDKDSVENSVKTLLDTEGRLDVLINNAGYALIGPIECISLKQAKEQFDVNFFGAFLLSKAALPIMRKQRKGHIINISSGAGRMGRAGLDLYCSSKFALEGLTESIASYAREYNVVVSVVQPGKVDTKNASRCRYGEENCETFFSEQMDQWRQFVEMPTGISPQSVGEKIFEIANDPSPNLRYQIQ